MGDTTKPADRHRERDQIRDEIRKRVDALRGRTDLGATDRQLLASFVTRLDSGHPWGDVREAALRALEERFAKIDAEADVPRAPEPAPMVADVEPENVPESDPVTDSENVPSRPSARRGGR